MEYRYLEIRKYEGNEVVKRMDVTGMSERKIDRIDSGMNINLNHKEYYITTVSYPEPQQKI